MIKKILLTMAVLVILATGIYMATRYRSDTPQTRELQQTIQKAASVPTPTPFPFRELTIPYLKERTYTSSLRDRSVAFETNTYTAYLTSYDSDGLKINGLLTIPKGDTPEGGWPAVVFVHGYIPPRQYRTQEKYVDYVDFIARNGLAVFKIDLRGHDNSEGEPSGAYYSTDYVIDTLNARAALQASEEINPDKIGLWGHSMAGNVVMRALAAQPNIPGIVIWAGAVYTYLDFREYGISDASYVPSQASSQSARRRQKISDLYGDISAESPFWRQVPATNYLEPIKGAIQVHHAIDDSVVPIDYSRNLMSVLDKTSIDHQLYEYPSGGHNISGASFVQAMQRTVEFYKAKL